MAKEFDKIDWIRRYRAEHKASLNEGIIALALVTRDNSFNFKHEKYKKKEFVNAVNLYVAKKIKRNWK